MALVTRPSVLLDEPRSNLDTITRAPQNAGQRCPTHAESPGKVRHR
ncbi:MAG: hypothetical protein ACJ75C_07105 [Actinomycetes bacterium]